jgi:hypothetical protein
MSRDSHVPNERRRMGTMRRLVAAVRSDVNDQSLNSIRCCLVLETATPSFIAGVNR